MRTSASTPSVVRIAEIHGAQGTDGTDDGDTLGYSAAAGDIDEDGRTDLITNEMVGNGIQPNTTDVGNLIVIDGPAIAGVSIFSDGFESGDAAAWTLQQPAADFADAVPGWLAKP